MAGIDVLTLALAKKYTNDKTTALSEEIVKQSALDDGAEITLADNVEYRADVITALTLALPDPIPDGFRCALDFGCGDTAAALVYPDTIVWTGDALDSNGLFVPLSNHRYHIDCWYDGACVRANASGVMV